MGIRFECELGVGLRGAGLWEGKSQWGSILRGLGAGLCCEGRGLVMGAGLVGGRANGVQFCVG